MKSPNKLNIITVVRNDKLGVKATLKSVFILALNNKNVEFVNYVQDGCSTDDTLEVVNDFMIENTRENLSIVINSEDDEGIFDAMNKATENMLNGDLVLYLNAGDTISGEFFNVSLDQILDDFIHSDSIVACFRSCNVIDEISYYMPPISIKDDAAFKIWIRSNTPVHQAMIFKVDNKYSIHYPLCFKIQADSFLFFYLTRYFGRVSFYDFTICKFELGGFSGNYQSFRKVIRQFYEQSLLMLLRQQSLIYIPIYFVSFSIKYLMHKMLGVHFFKLHAITNRLLRK